MSNTIRDAAPELSVLLTTAEVAKILKVNASTLSRWRTNGGGPRVTWLSPHIPRYQSRDVHAWLQKVAS